MNMKTNTICFILLFFVLITAASAADSDNETLENINQPDPNQDMNMEKLQMSESSNEVLSKSVENEDTLGATTSSQAISKTATVTKAKLKITMKAPDVKMYYKDGSKFKVTLKDSNKKVMKNTKVKITIDGKTYTPKTDSKGTASISLNLKSGTYKVTSTYAGSSIYDKKSVNSKVTIKSTIKCDDLTKYYKNPSAYYSKFYDKKGKLLKNTAVKFKINTKSYSVKTDKKGVGKLAIDLKPGKYSISSVNSKTSETITKSITIKSILETCDLTMTEGDGSRFSVKVLNCYGKLSPNKKVTLKVNGKTYTPKSNSNGIASQAIDLSTGKYTITTEYEGLKNTNTITVNKGITHSSFTHTTIIPNYVNVTIPYAFHNSEYTLQTGVKGIVKMPKIEVFTVDVGQKTYQFETGYTGTSGAISMEEKSYFIPFNGLGITCSADKNSLTGNGIIITKTPTSTEIDYKDITSDNIEIFGTYADKSSLDSLNSETFTYLKNDKKMAKITVQTQYFDETGVKYSLAKLFQKENLNFKYDEVLNLATNPIIFTNTGKPVNYSYFNSFIVGYQNREDLTTRFTINGKEELEKPEQISYGYADNYKMFTEFEILQSYCIINEKVTSDIVEHWSCKIQDYEEWGVINVYGMFLASIETAWLADELADYFAEEYNVDWERKHTLTILGGINLDDTYLNILNADMGMNVTGDSENAILFRLMNSFYLPDIEDYALSPVAERFEYNTTNSLDELLDTIESDKFSIVQMDDLFYIISEDGKNTTVIINATSGVAEVIISQGTYAYKGARISTTRDCCALCLIPRDILKNTWNTIDRVKKAGANILNSIMNKAHPLTVLGYLTTNVGVGLAGKIMTSGASLGLASIVGTMMGVHTIGNYVKNNFVEKKDWHYAYEHVTFTRDGYFQSKKFYNIPKSDGTYDYIEVGINPDFTLNRNDAIYVSNGKTTKLTKSETYKYFTEEKWSPYNIPNKYQKNKLPRI